MRLCFLNAIIRNLVSLFKPLPTSRKRFSGRKPLKSSKSGLGKIFEVQNPQTLEDPPEGGNECAY